MQIFFESRPVATLVASAQGATLRYERSWMGLNGAFPISTLMPLSIAEHGAEVVVPWIVNLLPESRQLEVISQITRIAESDVLGLLGQIGRDTSGALSFDDRGDVRMSYRAIPDDAALERVLNELPRKPFLVGDEGVSMSLAGVQSKMGVHVDADGRIGIPLNGAPSTWILKPDATNLWGGVYNEAFCLRLARNIGLQSPQVRIGRAGARKFLLVERYDRQPQGTAWRRLHQEDFCQALGLFPSQKYERNGSGVGGPGVADLIQTTRRVGDLASVGRLIRHIIFNIIACNTDAHAKNYGLLISARGASLAPLYDVMCGAVWPSITKNLAMTIADKNRGDYLKGRHWQREAIKAGLNPTELLRLVADICDRVETALAITGEEITAMDGDAVGMVELCRTEITQRVVYLRNGLRETE